MNGENGKLYQHWRGIDAKLRVKSRVYWRWRSFDSGLEWWFKAYVPLFFLMTAAWVSAIVLAVTC